MKRVFIFLFAIISFSCQTRKSELKLPSLISNNMVLQQKQQVTIWGKANPGTKVTISTSWDTGTTIKANADSTWQAQILTPEAGGPYQMKISNEDSTVTINNVLIGEVWLCSGQSNMEMPLEGWPPADTIANYQTEIREANYPAIRMFTVGKKLSVTPEQNCTGSWEICEPDKAGRFSATAYFFGRKLFQELNVPIGLIHSSWGGSAAESWVSKDHISQITDFVPELEKLEKLGPQLKTYEAWLSTHDSFNLKSSEGTDQLAGENIYDTYCSDTLLNTENWLTAHVPGSFERTTGPFDGVVWFRKAFELPASWAGQNAILNLGAVDDRDATWINGEPVGSNEADNQWNVPRIYKIPGRLLKAGKNLLAVKVTDLQGNGGISGNNSGITLSLESNPWAKPISLEGEWEIMPVAEIRNGKVYLFSPETNEFRNRPELATQLGTSTPTALYNGMIAPLINYSVKGCIWYQGETNIGRANQYLLIMQSLIANWRATWHQPEMPFYYVQLAPYWYNDQQATNLAELRESQSKLLGTPHTGMAVTLDAGSIFNIHPPYKQKVGERLGLLALTKTYGLNLPCTGPLPTSIVQNRHQVRILFAPHSISGGLVLKPGKISQFEIAGADTVFLPARAKVDSMGITIHNPGIKTPVFVRYCYRNNSEATLFNGNGLPASSFFLSINEN